MHGTGSSDERTDAEGPEEADESGAVTQAGVLGNLPKTRPSVRSPRRAKQSAEPPAPSRAEPADPVPEDRPAPEPARGGSSEPSGGTDIEALARGGIAIAGEAASLGLRIAGRAAAAVRDAVERR